MKSPVVNPDGTVTFAMKAPADAHVTVTGDFLKPMQIDTPQGKAEVPGRAELKQGADGVWSYTTERLAPELYSYTFSAYGQSILDPANVYVNRDVASLTSIFIVSDAKGDRGEGR